MLMRKVKDIRISRDVDSLVRGMYESGGFTAKKLAEGVDILERMVKEEAKIFLSFPACIISTGVRGVIKDMIKERMVDVIITTCGTLDHDIARSWKDYYHGSFMMDDLELKRKGFNRLGNIIFPNEHHGILIEEKVQEFLEGLWKEGKRELSSKELVWEFGKRMKNKDSIIYWAARNRIPVFIPGITDGAFGSQLWMFSQDHDFRVDVLKDEKDLADIVYDSKKTGGLIIGGGISKHHTIWWNQFRGGLDYVVYITTAPEWDGSLSGARPREAITWGKIKERAKHVTIEGDATVVLPIMIASLMERLKS
jgi:deoxyhypusine synthase